MNVEPRWVKKIVIAVAAGFVAGEIVSKLLGFVLIGAVWDLFLGLITPAFICIGLVYVLMQYTKEKDDMLGGSK